MKQADIALFEAKIQYQFRNKKLLQLAFTHSSYANEHKNGRNENNERLEFLGDAVLDLVISRYIYELFPEMPEGELTKLRAGVVCEATLAQKSRDLQLGDYLRLGKGEESTGGRTRDSILADVFEAVIGAVYLDSNIEEVEKYILQIMVCEIDSMKQKYRTIDCKTYLQEQIQKVSRLPISYEIVGEEGPDHNKVFIAEVRHDGIVLGQGQGRSKKEAEQCAADNAIKNWESQRKSL